MRQDTTDEIIKQHEGLVFHTLKILHCKPSDDVLSVAYEALWRASETYDSTNGTQFSTYAVTCIRNAVYDLFRELKDIQEMEVPLEGYLQLCTYDTFEEPDKRDFAYLHVAVDETLSKLSGKKQQIAKLWLESSMSVTAISKEIPCSQSYVSQTVAEVKAKLRKELTNAGYSGDYSSDSKHQ